jgi:hypothetical protein
MAVLSWQRWFTGLAEARLFSLVLVAVTTLLPFVRPLNGATIIGTLGLSLAMGVLGYWHKKPRPAAHWVVPILSTALFALYAFGTSWVSIPGFTPNLDIRLGLIAFPAMAAFYPFTARERDIVLFWLAVTITLLCLVEECIALRLYLKHGHSYYFLGTSLVYPFELHRVYQSIHVLGALVAVHLAGRAWANRFWWVVWQLFLGGMVLFLPSRTGFLFLVVLLGLLVLKQLWELRFGLALALVGGFALALGLLIQIPYARNIVLDIQLSRADWGKPEDAVYYDGTQVRHFVWQAADSVQHAMPWYGYGTGTARHVLQEAYKGMNFTYGIQENLNAHNQYWEVFLDLGWPGLGLLVTLLLAGLFIGLRQNSLLFAIMLITCLAFVTESYLEAQKGAVFFTLLWTLIGTKGKMRIEN